MPYSLQQSSPLKEDFGMNIKSLHSSSETKTGFC
jgi:hypothetical protein